MTVSPSDGGVSHCGRDGMGWFRMDSDDEDDDEDNDEDNDEDKDDDKDED